MTTVLHALVGYFYLLLTIRVLRRRPGAQMTPFEFVLIFLIGGVIILATVGDDRSETNSVCAIISIGLAHRLVAWAKQHFPRFGLVVDGTPLMLVADGEWQSHVMRVSNIAEDDVMAVARARGLKTLDTVQHVILERNGSISIVKRR